MLFTAGGALPGLRRRETVSGRRPKPASADPRILWPERTGYATYTGPRRELYGLRAIVQPGERRNRMLAQFNNVNISGGLAFGWHEFPRCHWRFDRLESWYRTEQDRWEDGQ